MSNIISDLSWDFYLFINIFLIMLGLSLICFSIVYHYQSNVITTSTSCESIYQGAVPVWADEDHFRKTGETIRRLNG